jgi:hypothetical protein
MLRPSSSSIPHSLAFVGRSLLAWLKYAFFFWRIKGGHCDKAEQAAT